MPEPYRGKGFLYGTEKNQIERREKNNWENKF